ncbi:MAG: hemolysin [Burkholderiales bacterium]|jgi:osmotically-inducible protein OsmY|nr:hemolysin [Burkholderiales bacterium]
MRKLVKFLISLTFVMLVATGVRAKTIGGYIDSAVDSVKDTTNSTGAAFSDQNLERKVNNVLSAQVPSGKFTVASYYKHILLTGQVPNKEAKERAVLAVRNTAEVKGVWDYLTVEPNESAKAVSNDARITSAAKNKLMLQKGVNSNNIKVVTDNGVVYLLGRDPGNKSKIDLAITEISKIDDVKQVENLIWYKSKWVKTAN